MCAELGLDQLHGAQQHAAGRAVDGDDLPLLDDPTVRSKLASPSAGPRLHFDVLRPHDARLPHSPRHDGGVTGHAAPRGENGARGDDAVEVLGARLGPHQDHGPAPLRERLGLIRVEDRLADGGAR